ncbi:UDP-glucose--hexose-1-phosphate uridylyltransferase [bacterium]|nr:UDP-glucose--hexose-1-phosphate uridylyltransferase [bacterium]
MSAQLGVHRRFDPLSGRWILVSPHRTQRPWSGQKEKAAEASSRTHDSKCYLCPRVTRVSGVVNPDYQETYVFENDVPALLPESSHVGEASSLFRSEPAVGTARVLCFSPRHDLTLADFNQSQFLQVIEAWKTQAAELGKTYRWVQIFENKGAAMGASSPHPHGQIWASSHLPLEMQREDENQANYFEKHKTNMLLDYAKQECIREVRVVVRNSDWIALIPYWATWPFETMILPLKHVTRFEDLDHGLSETLAEVLGRLLKGYDRLFETSFPYSMGWHMAPFHEENISRWTMHAHFYPPLLRSATVRKFMVGYELLAEAQRDLTAEDCAQRLRKVC